jgi:hypothetical protein
VFIDRLIHMRFQKNRTQEYRDRAVQALIRAGGKANQKLLDRLKGEWVAEQKDQQPQYRKDILRVLTATGDEDSLAGIREIVAADGRVSRAAAVHLGGIRPAAQQRQLTPRRRVPQEPHRLFAGTQGISDK